MPAILDTPTQIAELRTRLDEALSNTRIILQYVEKINRRTKHMEKTIADLDTVLATVDTDIASLQTEDAAVLAKLQAQPQTADVTAQVAHVQAIDTLLKALVTNDTAATAPPTPAPTPAPAPEPTPVPAVPVVPAV